MDKRTEADSKAPEASRMGAGTERTDFSAARARAAGNSARSAAASAADVDLFGEVRQPPPAVRQRPTNNRRPSSRPQAAPGGQEQLQGALLPFSDPIPARHLARSTPPIISGPRARIEAEVDEAFEGQGLGGTLADALPSGYAGYLTVIHLVELDIDLRRGPTLRQVRPGPEDPEVATSAAFWDLLAEANSGDRHEIDDDLVCIFQRGCAIWWSSISTLFWFTLRRDLVSLCQSYFRERNDILKVVDRAEKAAARAGDFALRFEDRAEWNRRNDEEDAARAELHRLYRRYGHHPLYPPHYL